ncbi:ABC transporter ATP-binding protein [Streptomyces sp. NPDC000880]
MTALTVREVTKSFGATPVLGGIDLHVPQESFTAILGPSGCGKTTLLRLIAGFDHPDDGTISFGDDVVFGSGRSIPPQRRRVGFVPQEGALFPHLTVAANITFGLARRDRAARHRSSELLELVGLASSLADRYPHQLSGGQQQRVALARALAPRPSIVLLDEPFSSLDAGLRDGTRRAVAQALRAAAATAVLVTHDQAEALSLADQVAVMRNGHLVQLDSPSAVYRHPSDTGVATFVGEAVLLPARVHDGQAECALGRIPVRKSADEGAAQVLIRPEQIQLHPRSDTAGVEARVADISYFGHDAAVRLDLLPSGPAVTARVAGHDLPSPGALVRLTVTGNGEAYPETVK